MTRRHYFYLGLLIGLLVTAETWSDLVAKWVMG